MIRVNARIASQKDLANWKNNQETLKARGTRLVVEQGTPILFNLRSFLSEGFWRAWRKDKAGMKAKGYRVARIGKHYIAYTTAGRTAEGLYR